MILAANLHRAVHSLLFYFITNFIFIVRFDDPICTLFVLKIIREMSKENRHWSNGMLSAGVKIFVAVFVHIKFTYEMSGQSEMSTGVFCRLLFGKQGLKYWK